MYKRDIVRQFTKSICWYNHIFCICPITLKTNFFKIVTISPISTSTSFAVQAYHIIASNHTLSNPVRILFTTNCIHYATPFMPRSQRIIGWNISINHFQIRSTDSCCLYFYSDKSRPGCWYWLLCQKHFTWLIYYYCFHI